jgi:hypothetical protein
MEQDSYDIIQRGKDVDAFIESKLGKYIIEKAGADRERAMVALGNADPTDAKLIAKIQQDYNTPNKVMMWLFSAKEEGKAKLLEEETRQNLKEEVSQ